MHDFDGVCVSYHDFEKVCSLFSIFISTILCSILICVKGEIHKEDDHTWIFEGLHLTVLFSS